MYIFDSCELTEVTQETLCVHHYTDTRYVSTSLVASSTLYFVTDGFRTLGHDCQNSFQYFSSVSLKRCTLLSFFLLWTHLFFLFLLSYFFLFLLLLLLLLLLLFLLLLLLFIVSISPRRRGIPSRSTQTEIRDIFCHGLQVRCFDYAFEFFVCLYLKKEKKKKKS